MVDVSFKRNLLVTQAEFTAPIAPGFLREIGDSFYLPLAFDVFDAPDISVTGCTLTATQTKIQGTAGAFNSVRVGDIVDSASTGSLTAKATFDITVQTFQGLNYIVYPHTFNSTNLGVKVGDGVSGTGIPSNTTVDKIDYAGRRIFLSANATATAASITATFAPPVRVTAVRTSTATSNANQIDIDSTVATSGSNSTVVIIPGAVEAIHAVVKLTPVSNTGGGRITYGIGTSVLDGNAVVGDASGLNGLTLENLTYASSGNFGIEADNFLAAARLPRPSAP